MDTVFSILHVATAVFIVGPMAILPMTGLRALRTGNAAQAAGLARSTTVFGWLSVLTFLLGFGVLGMAPKQYHLSMFTPWVLISIVLYLIAFALTMFLVVPQLAKAAAAGGEGKPAGYGAIAGGSGMASLLLLAVVVLMVWKP